jgi:hypothetical protein
LQNHDFLTKLILNQKNVLFKKKVFKQIYTISKKKYNVKVKKNTTILLTTKHIVCLIEYWIHLIKSRIKKNFYKN